MTRIILMLALSLTACGPAAPDWNVKDESGLEWRLIQCRHKADCMARANFLCKGPYIDRNGLKNPHEMMVRCREAQPDGWQ
jgi:hypothetical protein